MPEKIGVMSRFVLNRPVVMVGMMGAGKTAVGTALARLIGVGFVDSDSKIIEAADMTIAEIFDSYGEAFFRQKESLVLERLLNGTPSVLSTGGGAYLQKRNRDAISASGMAVWLRADRDLLWARVRHKETRPLLQVENPQERLFQLLKEREPAYQQAQLIVDSDENMSVQDMAEKVCDAVLNHPVNLLRKVS